MSAPVVTVEALRAIGRDAEADLVQWMLEHRAANGCDDSDSLAWVAQCALGSRLYWRLRDLITGKPGEAFEVVGALGSSSNLGSGYRYWGLYGPGWEDLQVTIRYSLPVRPEELTLDRWYGRERVPVRVVYDPRTVEVRGLGAR